MPTIGRNMYCSVDDINSFNDLAERLERVEAFRANTGIEKARKNIAPRIGISPTTLENYRTHRIKGVPHWLMQTIRKELADVLESEIERLGHALQIARQTGAHHRDDTLAAAEAQIAAARKLLRSE